MKLVLSSLWQGYRMGVGGRSAPLPLVGRGRGWGSGNKARSRLSSPTPHPDPPPAETAYTRVSATHLSDRNRQQPISIGGREKETATSARPFRRDRRHSRRTRQTASG